MRNDHVFMLTNQDSTFDFCRGDGEEDGQLSTAAERLKVKGRGLWTLNVTVRKTEI